MTSHLYKVLPSIRITKCTRKFSLNHRIRKKNAIKGQEFGVECSLKSSHIFLNKVRHNRIEERWAAERRHENYVCPTHPRVPDVTWKKEQWDQGNAHQNYSAIPPYIRMATAATTKKQKTSVGKDVKKLVTLLSWWECKLAQSLYKTVWRLLEIFRLNYHMIQQFYFWICTQKNLKQDLKHVCS